MRITRKRLGLSGLAAVAAVVVFAAVTGWFSPVRSWQQTSGLTRLADPPIRHAAPAGGDGPRFTWLGHSGYLIVWHGVCLLLDPNLSATCPPVKRLTPVPRPVWPDLPTTALISHAHYDHLDLPSLRGLPRLDAVLGPAGMDRYLKGVAAPFSGMQPGQSQTVGPLKVTAVPAQHGGNRNHPFASKMVALGYIIDDGTTRVYFAGDTALGEDMARIGAAYHPDIAVLPIGAYAPRPVLKHYHLNPEDAVAAAGILGAKWVIPCHFGTFRLAFDAPDSALPRFAAAADAAGVAWFLPPMPGDDAGADAAAVAGSMAGGAGETFSAP